MKTRFLVSSLALTAAAAAPAQTVTLTEPQAASGQWKQDDVRGPVKPETQQHVSAAQRAAGDDFIDALRNCNNGLPAEARLELPAAVGGPNTLPPEPARVFDNLYFLRAGNVTAWAIDTSDGIILIDALNNAKEAEELIAGGLKKFGLDPSRIRYVLVSHGHGDHYGGAAWLQKTYGARILMSDTDWKLSPHTLDRPWFSPAPPRDLTVRDGQKLKLGKTTMQMYITPGHTLGTVSVIFPVTDKGKRHMVAIWTGTGYNFPHSRQRFSLFGDSVDRFARLARKAGADVPLGNHAGYDTNRRIAALTARQPGEAHPFVFGRDGAQRFLTTVGQCARAYGTQMIDPPPLIPPAKKDAP